MEELETTFAKTLTLIVVEAKGVILKEDENTGNKEVLQRSLLAKCIRRNRSITSP